MVDIYQYENFRDYLRDLFAEKQRENPQYSQRQFAREAGISNPGFLNDVLKGRRTLSQEARQKVAKGFGIKAKEFDYFDLLVEFGQAKKPELKEELYQKLLFRRSRSQFARINPSLVKYYQDYRYPLVRASIEVFDFKGNFRRLGMALRPALPEKMVEKIVLDLLDWGLIYQNKKGQYFVTEKFVEPAPTLGAQVRKLNKNWFEQIGRALDTIPPEQRHVSTMLLAVSKEREASILQKIQDLREEIFQAVKEEENPEKVVQLSLALFPWSEEKQ